MQKTMKKMVTSMALCNRFNQTLLGCDFICCSTGCYY